MAKKQQRDKRKDSKRPIKKKVSILDSEGIDWVDYKDVELLKRFVSERGKLRARRVTGNNQQQQNDVATAVKTARELALLPYSVRVSTGAKNRRRRDRDDSRRDDDSMPTPPELSDDAGPDDDLDGGEE